MNKEEQEALEIIKGLEFYDYEWYVHTDKIEGHADEVVGEVEKAIETIVNLIDKQQKLIEELRETCNKYNDMRHFELVAHKYVSKDKIKEKIDELGKEYNNLFTEALSLDTMNINSHRYDAMKTVLEELLGE